MTEGYWDRITRTRITRRRALAGGVAATAAIAAAGAVGCGGDGKAKPSDQAPRSGGTLRTGTTLPLSSGLDPHLEQGTGLAIFPRVYGYLLHVDPRDDTVIKDHAESIEQPDPTTVIIRLRPDVTFQDIAPVKGRAVTAEDAALSIARYRDNQVVTNRTWHTTVLDKLEAVDDRTLRVTTKRPYAYTLHALGDINAGAIIPKELIESQVSLAFSGAGSGPFRIESATKDGGAHIVRNDRYFRAPVPYLDAMEWTVYGTNDDKLAAFNERNVDAIPNSDVSEARALTASSDEVTPSAEPSLAYVSLGFRCDVPPFNDPRLRGAVDLALDRAALVHDLTFGEGEALGPVNQHLANGFWSLSAEDVAAASGGAAIDDRRTAARALLQAAGAGSASFRLQVPGIPQLIDVATVVRDHIQRIGLQVTLEELDQLTWYANLRAGKFEATLISQAPYESPDIPTRFYHTAGPEGTNSPFSFSNGEIDRPVERSWGETDRSARRSSLLEAQRAMLFWRPMVQLFTSVGHSSAWSYVRNRQPELPGSLAQYNYEQWIARS
jgi:peptide/nickel transport system substrate-binding protein